MCKGDCPTTHSEQHKMIQELKDFSHKMTRDDGMEFEMFRKRDYDDEDLDSISLRKLQAMCDKYVVHRKKPG